MKRRQLSKLTGTYDRLRKQLCNTSHFTQGKGWPQYQMIIKGKYRTHRSTKQNGTTAQTSVPKLTERSEFYTKEAAIHCAQGRFHLWISGKERTSCLIEIILAKHTKWPSHLFPVITAKSTAHQTLCMHCSSFMGESVAITGMGESKPIAVMGSLWPSLGSV